MIDAQGALKCAHQNPRLKHNSVLKKPQKRDLHKGDAVLVKSYGQRGELLEKRGNHKWEVHRESWINTKRPEKISKQRSLTPKKSANPASSVLSNAAYVSPPDLRGHRYEQAHERIGSVYRSCTA